MADVAEVFRFAGCHGRLYTNTKSWDISFDLTFSETGAVTLAIADLPLDANTIELKKIYLDNKPTIEQLFLDAHDAESNHLTSDSVYLTSCNTPTDELGTKLESAASA